MKSHNTWTSWINLLSGLWIWLSASLFDLGIDYSKFNYIAAPIICTFAIISFSELNRNVIKLNILMAVFVIVGTLIVRLPTSTYESNLVTSVIVLVTAFVKRRSGKNYGGGWISLFQQQPLHVVEGQSAEKNRE